MSKNDRPKVLVIQRCTVCGCTIPIWRLRSRLKDDRHTKHMWCATCNQVTAHTQSMEE